MARLRFGSLPVSFGRLALARGFEAEAAGDLIQDAVDEGGGFFAQSQGWIGGAQGANLPSGLIIARGSAGWFEAGGRFLWRGTSRGQWASSAVEAQAFEG